MYFADSMKVDLDIAGNCEMESMRSAAVLVGRAKQAKEGEGRERNCRKELAVWPRHSALVKTAILRRLCLAVTRLPAETDVSPRSSPLGNVSRGGSSVTQRQKFHADDVKSVRNRFTSADY